MKLFIDIPFGANTKKYLCYKPKAGWYEGKSTGFTGMIAVYYTGTASVAYPIREFIL